MSGTKTPPYEYDVVEHLLTKGEMVACLEACAEEADGDAAFIAKVMGGSCQRQENSRGPASITLHSKRDLAGRLAHRNVFP